MARPAGRSTRFGETHDADTRSNTRRVMPASRHIGKLYVPREEIPEGMEYSWIAVEQLQEPDFARADEQAAKGWVPVPRKRHPRFAGGGSLIPGRSESDPYAQFIKVGGLLLCERSKDDVEADKEKIAEITQARIDSVGRWRTGEGYDPLMPRFDESGSPQRAHAASFKKE